MLPAAKMIIKVLRKPSPHWWYIRKGLDILVDQTSFCNFSNV